MQTFTNQARRRMMRFVAQIDWGKVDRGMMVTLTYPDEVAHNDKEKRNKERYLFLRYLENYLQSNVCGLWRVEWKPRQSGERKGELLPHIHIVIIGVKFIPYELFRVWWKACIKCTDVPMVNVTQFKKAKKAALYVSKYVAKGIDPAVNLDKVTYLNSGRHWGYVRKAGIPQCKVLNFPLLDAKVIHWVRVIAGTRLKYLDLEYFETFSLFGEVTVRIAEVVEGQHLTGEVWHPMIPSSLGGEP